MFIKIEGSYKRAAQEDRCGPRVDCDIPAMFRVARKPQFHTIVQDLSISGFSARAPNRLHPGQDCWIGFPGLEKLQAEVIWWDEGMVGCAFTDLLHPDMFEDLVMRDRSRPGSGQ